MTSPEKNRLEDVYLLPGRRRRPLAAGIGRHAADQRVWATFLRFLAGRNLSAPKSRVVEKGGRPILFDLARPGYQVGIPGYAGPQERNGRHCVLTRGFAAFPG